MDKSAVFSSDMRVKLRHAENNAKLPRTPFNIESAIKALFAELMTLNGPDENAERLIGALISRMASESELPDGGEIEIGVKILLNFPDISRTRALALISGQLEA